MNINVLNVKKDLKNFYEVIDIQSINSFLLCDKNDYLRASHISLLMIEDALKQGKKIFIPKNLSYSEVTPDDIYIQNDLDDLTVIKNAAKKYILNLMNDNVTRINILNVIDYMQCYMKLMNAGICITDDNREDKYFEIIENAQSIEEPKSLDENATFDQQYEYSISKQKYDNAQDNLKTLETYLNSYDQLAKINFVHKFLHNMLNEIDKSNTKEEVDAILSKNEEQIKHYFFL